MLGLSEGNLGSAALTLNGKAAPWRAGMLLAPCSPFVWVVGWVEVCKGNEIRQQTSTNRSSDFSEELTEERQDGDTALD